MCVCVQMNAQQTLQLAADHADLPPHVRKELATKSETVTPWWWGLKTLIKVHLQSVDLSPVAVV